MPARAEIGASPEVKQAAPRVIYEGDVNKESSPYDLHINTSLLSSLLREEVGMSDEEIGSLDIFILGKGAKPRADSVFDRFREWPGPRTSARMFKSREGRSQILIPVHKYYNDFLETRKRLLSYAEARQSTQESLGDYLKGLFVSWMLPRRYRKRFVTKRLFPYLAMAENSRADRFLTQVLIRKANKEVVSDIGHEAKHIVIAGSEDNIAALRSLAIEVGGSLIAFKIAKTLLDKVGMVDQDRVVLASVMVGLGTFHLADLFIGPYSELPPRRVEKRIKRSFKWTDCVRFEIKEA